MSLWWFATQTDPKATATSIGALSSPRNRTMAGYSPAMVADGVSPGVGMGEDEIEGAFDDRAAPPAQPVSRKAPTRIGAIRRRFTRR